jgi:ribosomal-protein-alanine N-acetyltransferase
LTYIIRPMTKEDLAQVTEIDREAFPTQWPPANYRHELQNQVAHYIVVCDDTRTIEEPIEKPQHGLSWLASALRQWFNRRQPSESNPPQAQRMYIAGFSGIWVLSDESHITNIAVRKMYQRQGIGELLLIATIDLTMKLKASTMTLEVRASNIAAQNLYSKYGFTQVGVRRAYYLDNREDGILMSTEDITSASFQRRLQQLREELARKLGSQLMTGETTPTANPEEK